MSASIIPMPAKGERNDIRETMIDIVRRQTGLSTRAEAAFQADWILLMLADCGFVVVPMEQLPVQRRPEGVPAEQQ